jgi:large subunit ribosomal protein L1
MAIIHTRIHDMFERSQLKLLTKKARQEASHHNFRQSAELILILRDIDVKKGLNINETVMLPHRPTKMATICMVASGEMGVRANKVGIDRVIGPDQLDRLGTNRREARKIARSYDFFLSDTALMSTVGRSLGQFLGPKGKMPTPLPYGAPLESIASRFRNSVRVKAKNQLDISVKIGDEGLDDEQLVDNATAIISAVERKLPQTDKNIRNAVIKFTMGKPSKYSTISQVQG